MVPSLLCFVSLVEHLTLRTVHTQIFQFSTQFACSVSPVSGQRPKLCLIFWCCSFSVSVHFILYTIYFIMAYATLYCNNMHDMVSFLKIQLSNHFLNICFLADPVNHVFK